jgi:hypothetical protein
VHRTFAGILGTAAFATTILCGWAAGGDAAAVLPRAATALVIFAVLGAACGRLALWMVEEGVAAQLHETLALNDKKQVKPQRK